MAAARTNAPMIVLFVLDEWDDYGSANDLRSDASVEEAVDGGGGDGGGGGGGDGRATGKGYTASRLRGGGGGGGGGDASAERRPSYVAQEEHLMEPGRARAWSGGAAGATAVASTTPASSAPCPDLLDGVAVAFAGDAATPTAGRCPLPPITLFHAPPYLQYKAVHFSDSGAADGAAERKGRSLVV